MKKSLRFNFTVLAVAMSISMIGCASTKAEPTVKANVDDGVDKVVVVDWQGRTMGIESSPQWLINMENGNSSLYKQMFGIDSTRVVKPSPASGSTEAVAQTNSRAGFAYKQAAELSQKVIGRVGQGLNDAGELEALYLAASQTKADMSGLREESTFWQKVKVTDADTKQTTTKYLYWTIYSMDKNTWDNICKKYLIEVMAGANLTTETQKKIAGLFDEMTADSDKIAAEKKEKEKRDYDLVKASTTQQPAVDETQAAVDDATSIFESVNKGK